MFFRKKTIFSMELLLCSQWNYLENHRQCFEKWLFYPLNSSKKLILSELFFLTFFQSEWNWDFYWIIPLKSISSDGMFCWYYLCVCKTLFGIQFESISMNDNSYSYFFKYTILIRLKFSHNLAICLITNVQYRLKKDSKYL